MRDFLIKLLGGYKLVIVQFEGKHSPLFSKMVTIKPTADKTIISLKHAYLIIKRDGSIEIEVKEVE